jgi:hypothetical protein
VTSIQMTSVPRQSRMHTRAVVADLSSPSSIGERIWDFVSIPFEEEAGLKLRWNLPKTPGGAVEGSKSAGLSFPTQWTESDIRRRRTPGRPGRHFPRVFSLSLFRRGCPSEGQNRCPDRLGESRPRSLNGCKVSVEMLPLVPHFTASGTASVVVARRILFAGTYLAT